eukprot:GHVQ01018857.1.p1 GENE.GHVQ01018857.1~~GHVQ01018857.1.p1  ORF type:complete len:127 (-),score=4.16 GHVQ01018857.1:23-403(-)
MLKLYPCGSGIICLNRLTLSPPSSSCFSGYTYTQKTHKTLIRYAQTIFQWFLAYLSWLCVNCFLGFPASSFSWASVPRSPASDASSFVLWVSRIYLHTQHTRRLLDTLKQYPSGSWQLYLCSSPAF